MKKLTLNVGCGERTFEEYPKGYKCVNLDVRPNLPHVDVVSDVRKIPFPDNHFDYILASDIIEHFPIKETNNVLSEWTRVLKQKGIIEFRMPNLRKICELYVKGVHDAKLTSWLLYGGQGYKENFHYIGFDRQFFKTFIHKHGFVEIEYKLSGNNFIMKVEKDG